MRLQFCLLLSIFIKVVVSDTNELGWCTMYDECGNNPTLENSELRGSVPCKNNVEAKSHEQNTAFFDTLADTCPELVPENATSVKACCSSQQLRTLASSLAATSLLFSRCPSCVSNMNNLFCQATCSPDQATFVNVTRFMENGQEHPIVLEYTAFLKTQWAETIFDSCKDVVFPQTNGKAIDLVCNGYSGPDCTTQRWLEYIGSTNNGIAPLDIVYALVGNSSDPYAHTLEKAPEPFDALETKVYSCTEPPKGKEPCSCTDCSGACPPPPPKPPTEPPFLIDGKDGVGVIAAILFGVFVLFFIVYLTVSCYIEKTMPKRIDFKLAEKDISQEKYSKIGDDVDNQHLVTLDEISCFEKWGKKSQDFFEKGFTAWGKLVAEHPILVLIISIVSVVVMSVGITQVILTTDPIQLWSAENSKVRQEKTFYDEHFGAFYRTEQVIITLRPDLESSKEEYLSYTGIPYNFSAILSKERMLEILKFQESIEHLKAPFPEGIETLGRDYVTLQDICFKPLSPDNNNCTVMSVLNYWQNNPEELDKTAQHYDRIKNVTYEIDYHDHFLYCVQAPNSIQDTTALKQNCMGEFGGPVLPYVALGGYESDEYHTSEALLLSFVVNNYPRDSFEFRMSLAWEEVFLNITENWKNLNNNFTYAYFSERSIEDEIVRSSKADLVIFAGSYIAIFLYITIALGTYTSFARIPVDSKVTLGFAGILIILGSVFASIGFYGYVGISTSLIVIEVVPFLVLAIGADNVFILTLEFQNARNDEEETLENKVSRVLGKVGPSMLLCSLTEAVTFFLGALSDMPAVQEFALCAALAIVFDFLLQVTAFVAILTLDAKRQQENRSDCICCVKVPGKSSSPMRLQNIFKKYYAPVLMHDIVRIIVMLVFLALFFWSIYIASHMEVGLDQDLSVPTDSYVLDYFDYMQKYLSVGVPVYFVTKGPYNFSNPESSTYVCGTSGCDPYSLIQQISFAATDPEYSKIEVPASSWLDDYRDWIKPQGIMGSSSCCRHYLKNESEFCSANDRSGRCRSCLSSQGSSIPTSEQFMEYLPWFLKDNPGVYCNKGGHAAYGNAVSIEKNENGVDVVSGSYFSTYHSICIKSSECTDNLKMARQLADNITKTLYQASDVPPGFEVYPYCLYYVYYDQYLTMVEDTMLQLGICLIPTFIFNFILLGFDLYSGFIAIFTILMIVVDTAAICSLWEVDLNAVSLINLVAAIGLSVEFTSHVVRTFSLNTSCGKKKRVIESMATMGPAVFAGVALTNLPGIIVLAFAKAQLIQIFFFRMCLVITLLGMVHGLVFLPVFLSYFGPPVNKALLFEKQATRREVRNSSVGEGKKKSVDVLPGHIHEVNLEDEHEYEGIQL